MMTILSNSHNEIQKNQSLFLAVNHSNTVDSLIPTFLAICFLDSAPVYLLLKKYSFIISSCSADIPDLVLRLILSDLLRSGGVESCSEREEKGRQEGDLGGEVKVVSGGRRVEVGGAGSERVSSFI